MRTIRLLSTSCMRLRQILFEEYQAPVSKRTQKRIRKEVARSLPAPHSAFRKDMVYFNDVSFLKYF